MTQRDRIVLIVVVAVVGLAAYWMLALKPKREDAAKLGKQVDQAQQKVDAARADVAAGQAARSAYAVNYARVARLGKAVPTDDDVPSLVYQLDTTAQGVGVDFRSIKLSTSGQSGAQTPSTSAGGAAAASDQANSKAGADKQSQGGSNGGGSQPSSGQSTTASAPASPTQTATAALPPGAVVGSAGLSTMPFTFTFRGSFFHLADFLTRIDRYVKPRRASVNVRGRLLVINGIALHAAESGFPTMTASISASGYLLPVSQGLFNGSTPQGPAGSGSTQPVSSGGSASPAAPATVTP